MVNVDPTNSFFSMPNIKFNSSSNIFFHFYLNQTSSTNYGVIVSAPNFALFSLVPGSTRSFCSLIGSFDGQRSLRLTKEILFDLVKKQTTNKQTKATSFCQKQDIQLKQLATYLWFQGINSRKKGNLCSG